MDQSQERHLNSIFRHIEDYATPLSRRMKQLMDADLSDVPVAYAQNYINEITGAMKRMQRVLDDMCPMLDLDPKTNK